MWAVVIHLPSVLKSCVLVSFFLTSISGRLDHGRHRTPIKNGSYQWQKQLGSSRVIHPLKRHASLSPRISFPNTIIPLRGLFSIVNTRSRSHRVPSRLTTQKKKQLFRSHKVPNFVHLQAEKIPGYEKFKLDEYIRDKPDVIHYVESPVIEPKKTKDK